MPKKINRNGNSFKAVRKFTDREEPRKAFWDKYGAAKTGNADDINIITYY